MMSTPSKCCSASQVAEVITGVVAMAALGTLLWVILTKRGSIGVDPLAEADRRIGELEGSLHRLQDTFAQAIRS